MVNKKNDLSIVLCGEAGQGIKTVEIALTRILKFAGFNVFATKEYMSRIRGGANSTEIRISSGPIQSYVDRIDLLIPLNRGTAMKQSDRFSDETIVIGEKDSIEEVEDLVGPAFEVAFEDIAKEIGKKIYSNIVAVGVVCGILDVDKEIVRNYLIDRFSEKSEEVIQGNIDAAEKGFDIGEEFRNSEKISIVLESSDDPKDQILINGAEAVSLGAIAGGCNVVTSYPMSPSTAVLVFLSQHWKEFEIFAEQAEDEISAVNMAIGAWYGGGRAMITTSGGGFALMEEGISLAGIIESPLVMHLAQRPGPGTGLPTRTEQGDLLLALNAGHGEFPRFILTPGNLEECFYLAAKAFNLADKYQVPVMIITDQYLLDSYYNIDNLPSDKIKPEKFFIKTEQDYKRFKLTGDGISPRGIPGYGDGLVKADSDEHDEAGFITEDFDVRVDMVDKRLKKFEAMKEDHQDPVLIGDENYETLVIGWGSTRNVISEALCRMNREGVAQLHFPQVFPLPQKGIDYLEKADKTIIIENNATGQFGQILKLHADFICDNEIHQYNGLPFSVEKIVEELEEIL